MKQKTNIRIQIQSEKGRLISFLSRLLKIKTENPPGRNYAGAVRLLEKFCQSLGMKTKVVRVPLNTLKKHGISSDFPRVSLIAELDLGLDKWLHINGHFDVVPATFGWKTGPFCPVINQGRIYARGSQDMKSSIAATLFALKVIKQQKKRPGFNIQLSFVPDEETGGELGFAYLFKKGLIKADYAIGEGQSGMYVGMGNKGLLWFDINVIGKSSHGAYPEHGINAFEHGVKVAIELNKLKEKVQKRKTAHPAKDPGQRHASFVMGGWVKGGNKTNTVPGSFSFSIDRRLLPEESIKDAEDEVNQVVGAYVKKHSEVRIKVRAYNKTEPVVSDMSSSFCREFLSLVEELEGRPPKPVLMSGGTDIRHLCYKGVPAVSYSPLGRNLHADDEYVEIESLLRFTELIARTILGRQ